MPNPRSAGVYERRGRFFARVAMGPRSQPKSRKSAPLPTCTSWEEAEARSAVIFQIVERLRAAGQTDLLEKIIEQAAAAAADKLPALMNVVSGIIAGSEHRGARAPALADAISFQTFAEQWTNGELNALHPDHIAEKRTSRFDKYRLERHVYPVVGTIPLVAFRLQNAEEVMRRIPRKLSTASRRQIAQLLRRVLQLAEYPARIIEHSPIPRGFLPKVTQTKALAYLYPDEDAKLLACTSVPLVHRLLYGVLAREGLRSNEALTLCWSDLDLERGAIRLDTNKTDDPRAGPSMPASPKPCAGGAPCMPRRRPATPSSSRASRRATAWPRCSASTSTGPTWSARSSSRTPTHAARFASTTSAPPSSPFPWPPVARKHGSLRVQAIGHRK